MSITRVTAIACGLGAVSVLALAPAGAQAEWPERPVTIIVPAGAGGGTDATGRLLALGLEEQF